MKLKPLSDERKQKLYDDFYLGNVKAHSIRDLVTLVAQETQKDTVQQTVEEINRVAESYKENHDFVIIPESFIQELKKLAED